MAQMTDNRHLGRFHRRRIWWAAKASISHILTREGLGGCGGEDETPLSRISSEGGAMGAGIGEKPLRLAFEQGRGREWCWVTWVAVVA
jgi:hypothetical protein